MSFQPSKDYKSGIQSNVSFANDKRGDKRYERKCEIQNYLPHPTPEYSNREAWHNSYKEQLVGIYENIRDVIDSEFPKNKIKWDNVAINNLSKLIYHCSSKYISPYI